MLRSVKAFVLSLAVCSSAGLFLAQQLSTLFQSEQNFDAAEVAGKAVSCDVSCDFNHDGKPDALSVVRMPHSTTVRVTMGGVGTRDLTPSAGSINSAGLLSAADLNGDRNLDVVWQPTGLIPAVAWFGDGKGGFIQAAPPSLPVPISPLFHPFRIDPLPDLPTLTVGPLRPGRGPARPCSEVALWIARTVNPPPSSSLFS